MDNSHKFINRKYTAEGEERAFVTFQNLKMLWVNTGTLCNIECVNCYIESSPHNDRLSYIKSKELKVYLDDMQTQGIMVDEIGFTGGEPFMNPDILTMINDVLSHHICVLILTNAMKPMQRFFIKEGLCLLHEKYRDLLKIRVSLDHYTQQKHDKIRGQQSWESTLKGIQWLYHKGFNISIASRSCWEESEQQICQGFKKLFTEQGWSLNAESHEDLIIFPEMELKRDVPEITTRCWDTLNKSADNIMCSHSRMLVKRKNALKPTLVSCTLLPYDRQFDLGSELPKKNEKIYLNHPYCAQFCVLGNASCSG